MKIVFSSYWNGIFVINPIYPAAIFDKSLIFFIFYWVKPSRIVWQILGFFFYFFIFILLWNPAQLLKLKTGFELRLGFEKLVYFKWWVMINYNILWNLYIWHGALTIIFFTPSLFERERERERGKSAWD